jgi:hypothetical protein
MKKRSAYRPRHTSPKLRTQPWRINAALDPLRTLLDQIERTGCIDSTARGVPIFHDIGKHYYELTPAILGVVEVFELATARHGWQLDQTPLRRLSTKLESMCPIDAADINAARACIESIHRHALTLTIAEAAELTRTVQISEALQRAGVTPT